MARHSNVDALLKKLARPAEKVGKKRVTKLPWRHRKSNRAGIKLTDTERQELKDRREKKRDELEDALNAARETMYKYAEAMSKQFEGNHSPNYYFRLIMQRSNLKLKPKKLSGWNVFVHKGMKELNAGQSRGNRDRVSSGGHMKDLSARWKSMTEEERAAAIGDSIEELEERRENRKEGVQNVLINSFHDTRATLGMIQRELEFLTGRTGMCVLTIAVRPNLDSYNAPFVFVSEPRVSQYFETLTKKPIMELAMGLEGFCISGITSLTLNHKEKLHEWKNKTGDLIFEKLRAASTRGEINKMYYVNFDKHITFKFGVVLDYWPVQKFTAPGNFSSIPIISIIYNAFESGATRFRSLSDEEWKRWREDFLAGKSAPAITAAPSPAAVEAAAPSPGPETPDSAPAASADATPAANTAVTDATPTENSGAAPTTSSLPAPVPQSSAGSTAPEGVAPTTAPLPGASAIPHATESTSTAVIVRGEKRTIDQVADAENTADIFVNNYGGTEGLQVTKRPRKKRSDAGVKRGPRKKPTTGNATPTPTT